MSLKQHVFNHHRDELKAIEDVEENQRVRVSIERRILNMEKLINEHVPDTSRKVRAIAALADFRKAAEKMLDAMEIPF